MEIRGIENGSPDTKNKKKRPIKNETKNAFRTTEMRVEMSPAVYLALCGLVKDAMQIESDAAPLLMKAARELAAAAGTDLPESLQHLGPQLSDLPNTTAEKSAA